MMKKKCRCRYSTVIYRCQTFCWWYATGACSRFLEVIFALKLHSGQLLCNTRQRFDMHISLPSPLAALCKKIIMRGLHKVLKQGNLTVRGRGRRRYPPPLVRQLTIKHPSAVIKRAHLDLIRQIFCKSPCVRRENQSEYVCWLEMEVGAHLQHPLKTQKATAAASICFAPVWNFHKMNTSFHIP